MNLTSRVAIVTGASEGIGRAISETLIREGAQVTGLARRQAPLEEAARLLGPAFRPIPCDVRDLNAVSVAVGAAVKAFSRVDILVNNAGVGRFGPIDELSKEDWDEMMDTNVTGVFHMLREVVPIMKRQGSGHIVNVASIAGLLGNPNLAGYNASKFALRGMSEALFKELREFGIKVSAVFPGSVETSFQHSDSAASHKMSAEEVAEVVIHILERSDNFLVSDVVLRPLRPKG
jgi:NAD(P)-dependent dehydrogenase (short-subunit alcohol dehydrogenase family)